MSGYPFLSLHDLDGNDLAVSIASIVSVFATEDGATEINLGTHTLVVDELTADINATLHRLANAAADLTPADPELAAEG